MILTFLAKHWKTPHNQPLYFHFSSFCQCIYYTLLFISISFLYAIPEREKNYSLKSNVVASSAVVVCVFLVPEFLRFTHLFMCVCMCVCGCFYSHALSISLAFSRYFYLFVCLFLYRWNPVRARMANLLHCLLFFACMCAFDVSILNLFLFVSPPAAVSPNSLFCLF